MDSSNTILHVGSLIRTELVRQNRTVLWLAQNLSIKRPNCYRLLNASSIHTDVLLHVSKVLQHDFFADCSSILQKRISL